MGVNFRLLGRFEAEHDGDLVDVGRRRERCLLGILLLQPNVPTPTERLVDLLWDDPPGTARASLHTHVARLRTILDPDGTASLGLRLEHRQWGYVAEVEASATDAHRFQELVARAMDLPSPGDHARVLREAMNLWRGPILEGDASDRLRDRIGAQLNEMRLSAAIRMCGTELAHGDAHRVVGDLTTLVSEHPHQERFDVQLMIALYRCGRHAEALDAYRRAQTRLADDLGVDPGPQLQRAHVGVLRHDDRLLDRLSAEILAGEGPAARERCAAGATPTVASVAPVPRQLPADIVAFTGRHAVLRELDRRLAEAASGTGLAILAITGAGGMGKTALAVHWAHRVAARFPDGQLYLNLRGFAPEGQAMTVGEGLRAFFDALDVAPQRIPSTLEGQAALYRSLLASRQMLIVLDNASGAEQVRPLLPGTPGCLVLVTSRNRLGALAVNDGAYQIALDPMLDHDAREMLARRLGADRVSSQPQAVHDIIDACARLPLALAVAAARAHAHPGFPLADFAQELRTRGALDALSGADTGIDVRAVFSWSYQVLGPGAARLMRLLALHPGPDFAIGAAASLAGATVAQIRPLLDELAAAHLVEEHRSQRYAFHDLLRGYATELLARHHTRAEREAGIRRLAEYYLRCAHSADRLLFPHRDPIPLGPARRGIRAEEFRERDAAMAWLSTQRRTLVAMVSSAAANGQHAHAWRLGWTLAEFLDWQGHWLEQADTQRVCLDSARVIGERIGQAQAHRHLGRALLRLDLGELAHAHYQEAITLFAALDDPAGQASTRLSLAFLLHREGHTATAIDHARQGLRLYQLAGHPFGEAIALNAVGWYHTKLNQCGEGLSYSERALALQQRIGDLSGQAGSLASIGNAHERMGDHREAMHYYRASLRVVRQTGLRDLEADTLVHMGETANALGDRSSAVDAWRQALAILDDIDPRTANRVRRKLNQLVTTT